MKQPRQVDLKRPGRRQKGKTGAVSLAAAKQTSMDAAVSGYIIRNLSHLRMTLKGFLDVNVYALHPILFGKSLVKLCDTSRLATVQ